MPQFRGHSRSHEKSSDSGPRFSPQRSGGDRSHGLKAGGSGRGHESKGRGGGGAHESKGRGGGGHGRGHGKGR